MDTELKLESLIWEREADARVVLTNLGHLKIHL